MNSDITISSRADATSIKYMQERSRAYSAKQPPLSNPHPTMLLIRAKIIRLEISSDRRIILGRFDFPSDCEIDLTPYGAKERGVSRCHVLLSRQNNCLYIKDLDSTNGSYVGNRQLIPNVETVLNNGSEMLLGRLNLQVMF